MDRDKIKWWTIETCASVLTLTGMYIGSTTVHGASWYLASMVFWFWICLGKKMYGLLPLNLATVAITTMNLLKALQ